MDGCLACLRAPIAQTKRTYFAQDMQLSQLFSLLTSIEIPNTTTITGQQHLDFVCHRCEEKLVAFGDFRAMCLQSNQTIQRYAAGEPIEHEEEDHLMSEDELLLDNGADDNDVFIEYPFDDDNDLDNVDEEHVDSGDVLYELEIETNADGRPADAVTEPIDDDDDDNDHDIGDWLGGPFQCERCGEQFDQKSLLQRHVHAHVGLKPYHCYQCSTGFRAERTLDGHRHYECAHCPPVLAFRRREWLRRHQRIVHDIWEGAFKCEHCSCAYDTANKLARHLTLKHRPTVDVDADGGGPKARRYVCTQPGCTKSYASTAALDHHCVRDHSLMTPGGSHIDICDQCGQSFVNPQSFKEHLIRHGDRATWPFACDRCPKRFVNRQVFVEHMNRHEGKWKHACPHEGCAYRAFSSAALKRHALSHKPVKDVQCPHCPQVFRGNRNLRMHFERVHLGIKPFACAHCDRRFNKKISMVEHSYCHTGELPQRCPHCDQRFRKAESLRMHIKRRHKK